jgi:hypothetical protein
VNEGLCARVDVHTVYVIPTVTASNGKLSHASSRRMYGFEMTTPAASNTAHVVFPCSSPFSAPPPRLCSQHRALMSAAKSLRLMGLYTFAAAASSGLARTLVFDGAASVSGPGRRMMISPGWW